jgi:hypothetical protein
MNAQTAELRMNRRVSRRDRHEPAERFAATVRSSACSHVKIVLSHAKIVLRIKTLGSKRTILL